MPTSSKHKPSYQLGLDLDSEFDLVLDSVDRVLFRTLVHDDNNLV